MYKTDTVKVERIKGALKTYIKKDDKVFGAIYATQKTNQKAFAKLVASLGMNEEAKGYIISAIKEKANIEAGSRDIPEGVIEFMKHFEKYVAS